MIKEVLFAGEWKVIGFVGWVEGGRECSGKVVGARVMVVSWRRGRRRRVGRMIGTRQRGDCCRW